jgi:putative membrane protein insertion efficiency factor
VRLLRFLSIGIIVAGVAIVLMDLGRPPAAQRLTQVAVGAVHLYQATMSPLLAYAGVACRFEPTCSRYAEVVIGRDGVWTGGRKALGRLVRCGPWTPMGTVDRP